MVFIYTTCEDMDEAKVLGEIIISKKIGACVDFWPITSCYQWEGSLKCVSHVMIMITTFEAKLDEVNQIISENHTYSIPLIAGVDVRRINHPYKEWMSEMISL
jgi:periplasmic divalent cation tolerance protein